MNYTIIFLTVILLFIISCSTAPEESEQTRAQQQNQVQNKEIVGDAPDSAETPLPAASSQSLTAESAPPVLLNPPHGEPGHSCDIPVGSPLPSAEPASAVVLNPPHGEPGHRCEIPVGSPLNKAPEARSDAAARPAPGASLAPTIENAERLYPGRTQRSTSTAARSGTRLNPPHGQPGHRCEIPVGSPLP